jgi:hypothetical protein
MAYYTVYYTVPFYPYKSLIYKGFSAAGFSVNPKKSDTNLRQLPTLKALIFLSAFPTFGGENCHRQSHLVTVCPRDQSVYYTLIARSRSMSSIPRRDIFYYSDRTKVLWRAHTPVGPISGSNILLPEATQKTLENSAGIG